MTEINDIKPAVGQIQIADEVIAIIAATAVQEVEGITTIHDGGITNLFGKKNNQSKGVKVTVEGNEVTVNLNNLERGKYTLEICAMDKWLDANFNHVNFYVD